MIFGALSGGTDKRKKTSMCSRAYGMEAYQFNNQKEKYNVLNKLICVQKRRLHSTLHFSIS